MIEKTVLRLLSIQSYSSDELRKKLTRRGFAAEEIEAVLAKFRARGFIDDVALAERRSELYQKKGYGPQWIRGKLKLQGLRSAPYGEESQIEAIKKLLATPQFSRKDRNKKIAALQRRGFDLEIIFQLLTRDTNS